MWNREVDTELYLPPQVRVAATTRVVRAVEDVLWMVAVSPFLTHRALIDYADDDMVVGVPEVMQRVDTQSISTPHGTLVTVRC